MKANIIDNWLKENTNPKIDKQVENEYKEIMNNKVKDKAEELIEKFLTSEDRLSIECKLTGFTAIKRHAKQCALICVDEIIKALKITLGHLELRILDAQEYLKDIEFYQQVKQEILNRQ